MNQLHLPPTYYSLRDRGDTILETAYEEITGAVPRTERHALLAQLEQELLELEQEERGLVEELTAKQAELRGIGYSGWRGNAEGNPS